MNSSDLLSHMNPNDLVYEATALVAWEVGAAKDMDQVAGYLYKGGPNLPQAGMRPPNDGMGFIVDDRPDKKYWTLVKEELTTFLCTSDKKYKELWSRITALENKGTNAIVLLISGYLGEQFGLQASILAGFVAVFLYGVIKIGKEAYCRLAIPE